MSGNYLAPDDVSPAHARQVLDFLNSAQTAREIADRVEIPGELDIGERLAARILARRQELGGFEDLQQIADVPLIGPERFTEIVITLSDARPLPSAETTIARLAAELDQLRRQVAALQTAPGRTSKVSIRALQGQSYLGEAINLVVQVTDPTGTRPVVDAPVTLVATWGRLRAVDGTRLREGSSLVTRTDDVGMARALLYPPTSEDLLPSQQASLQNALGLLSRTATAPHELEDGLREVARQYRWHGNPDLRSAVDIYFRDFGRGLVESVNHHDYLAGWMHQEATILAMVGGAGATSIGAPAGGAGPTHGEGTGPHGAESASAESISGIEVSAALTLRIRNWLGAFLEVLQTLTDSEARLSDDLREAVGSEEAGALLGRVYLRLNDYVVEQRGVMGEFVGQRLAERSLRDFLQNDIAELPVDLQRAVIPSLQVASRTVKSAGTQVLAAVGETRKELRKEILTRPGDHGLIDDLNTRIDGLDGRIGEMIDTATFSAFQRQLDGRFDAKVDQAAFTGLQQNIDARLANKVDQAVFVDFRQQLELDLGNRVTIEDLAGFETRFNANLDRKVDQTTFVDFRDRIEFDIGLKVDVTTFDTFSRTTRADLAGKASLDAFNGFQQALEADLAGKADGALFDSFRNETAAGLARKADAAAVDGVRRDLGLAIDGFNLVLEDKAGLADIAAIDERVARVGGEMAQLKGASTRLDRQVATLNSSLSRIDQDVTTLRTRR